MACLMCDVPQLRILISELRASTHLTISENGVSVHLQHRDSYEGSVSAAPMPPHWVVNPPSGPWILFDSGTEVLLLAPPDADVRETQLFHQRGKRRVTCLLPATMFRPLLLVAGWFDFGKWVTDIVSVVAYLPQRKGVDDDA